MDQSTFNIHGVSVLVSSANERFLNFVKTYFRGFERGEVPDVSVRVSVTFSSGFSFRVANQIAPSGNHIVLGEGIYFLPEEKILRCFVREISFDFKFGGTSWDIQAVFKKNFFRHISNILFFKGRETQSSYYRMLTRLLVQNLVFLKLEQMQGMRVVSGGAFATGDNAYLFLGLPGSGKTTVLRALSEALPTGEVLSENFALLKNGKVFIFPEGKSSPRKMSYTIQGIYTLSYGKAVKETPYAGQALYAAIEAIDDITAELPTSSVFGALALAESTFQFMYKEYDLRCLLGSVKGVSACIDYGAKEFAKHFKEQHG